MDDSRKRVGGAYITFPCKDCEKKGCGQHQNCEKYQEAKRKNEEIKKRVRGEREIAHAVRQLEHIRCTRKGVTSRK